jgi:DNA-binding Lrp family transcriptional regulator
VTDQAPSRTANFTPMFDGLAAEHGIVTSAVFGRIWRYALGEQRVCTASLETISKDLGVDRATVMRHTDKLQELGMIEDLTPTRRNHPHAFAITEKGICIATGVAPCNTTEDKQDAVGVAESHSGVAESHSTVAQRNTGVAESHLKRGFKREVKKEVKREAATPARDPTLRIDSTPGGEVVKKELDTCYSSKNPKRLAPEFYSNTQQRDLFLTVFASLNGQLKELTRKAISRDRVSLPSLLAFLEVCVKNNQASAGKVTVSPKVVDLNNLDDQQKATVAAIAAHKAKQNAIPG